MAKTDALPRDFPAENGSVSLEGIDRGDAIVEIVIKYLLRPAA